MALDLATLRAFAVRRSLFPPAGLDAAIQRLGFVQADPIRAPARAQDLILRPRVRDYRAADLEREFERLDVAEDFLHVYGFVARSFLNLLHPRVFSWSLSIEREAPGLAETVLAFVRERGPTHPRELEGVRVTNYWGGRSKSTTRMLDALHYRGLLRVVRRDRGIRVYAPAPPSETALDPDARVAGVVRLLARLYSPVPERSLYALVAAAGSFGAPIARGRRDTVKRLVETGELARETVDGLAYLWPAGEDPAGAPPSGLRLLAPFDPIVWDRRRFEHLWGWAYRFEAYTPAPRRKLGYYALPLLWQDRVVGWANLRVQGRDLVPELGFAGVRPRERGFAAALERDLAEIRAFLGLERP